MNFSPLFWPVELKGNTIYILDETALPQKIKYIKAVNYQQAARAIKEMKTRAAGQVILVLYALLLSSRKKIPLNKAAQTLNSARPTLPFKILTDMALDWQKQGLPLEKCILGFLDRIREKRIRQAEEAAALINDGDCILTHCNISGLMPLIGDFCRRQNKKISFFVTETRPYLQGMRLTAWELKRGGFKAAVIADNMVAEVMFEGKIDKVIVGADHLAQNGDIANKVGTYQIAILARHFNIPFYVLCPPPSAVKSGSRIKIEIRPDKELLEFAGKRIAPLGVKGYYPAFDVTPAGFITRHIYLEI